MSRRSRHISKTQSTLAWTISLLLLLILTYFSVVRKGNAELNEVKIAISTPQGERKLITSQDIVALFNNHLGYDIRMATIESVDIINLEKLLDEDDRVKEAEVYVDSNDDIHIHVKQKNVIGRVMQGDVSYYLDDEGNKIHSRLNHTVRVPVVTGDLESYSKDLINQKKRSRLKDVYTVLKEIKGDKFLRSLIEQIDVESSGKLTLVPKAGRAKITMNAEDIEEKFIKLKYFYKDGLPKAGWSKYATLKLDTKEQVVVEKLKDD